MYCFLYIKFRRKHYGKQEIFDSQRCSRVYGHFGAYGHKIIRRLNDELVAAGYIIVSGRISRSYFEKKIYGGIA